MKIAVGIWILITLYFLFIDIPQGYLEDEIYG